MTTKPGHENICQSLAPKNSEPLKIEVYKMAVILRCYILWTVESLHFDHIVIVLFQIHGDDI